MTPRAVGLVATILAISGCTIQTYPDTPPPPPPRRPPPAAATAEPARPATPRKPGIFRPGAAPAPGSETAPRIGGTIPFGSGTTNAFRGLAYVVPDNTTKLPDFTQLTPFATLYTDRFDVSSQNFTQGFPGALAGQVEWFGIRYDGRFAVATDGNWQFKLVSDDGAVLYVDGAKVVDNDGVHTATAGTGMAQLKAGPHALRLDYFQAKGPVALQLFLLVDGRESLLVGTR